MLYSSTLPKRPVLASDPLHPASDPTPCRSCGSFAACTTLGDVCVCRSSRFVFSPLPGCCVNIASGVDPRWGVELVGSRCGCSVLCAVCVCSECWQWVKTVVFVLVRWMCRWIGFVGSVFSALEVALVDFCCSCGCVKFGGWEYQIEVGMVLWGACRGVTGVVVLPIIL